MTNNCKCGHSEKIHLKRLGFCCTDSSNCLCERFEPEMIDIYPKTWDEEMIKAVEKMEEEEEQAVE